MKHFVISFLLLVLVACGGGGNSIDVVDNSGALDSISLSSSSTTIPAGLTAQLSVVGTFRNSTTSDLLTKAIFTSSDASILTVNSNGVVTGLKKGSATITASATSSVYSKKFTSAISLAVTDPLVQSLVITNTSSPPAGLTDQLKAIATYSDGTTGDLTKFVSWKSSDTSTVTVDSNGVARGVVKGSAVITASYPSTASSTVDSNSLVENVLDPTPLNLAISFVTAGLVSILDLTDTLIQAIVSFSNGVQAVLNSVVTWFVSASTGSEGSGTFVISAASNSASFAATSPGPVAISATYSGLTSNSLDLTIALSPTRIIAFGDGFNAVDAAGYGVNTVNAVVGTDLPDDTIAGRMAYNKYGITLTNVSGTGVLDVTKKGFSYAQGSARIQNAATPSGDSVEMQISNYLSSNSPSSKDLFIITAGSLDIYDAFINNTALSSPIAAYVSAIKRLTDSGAKYVLIVYPPNMEITPWAIRKNNTDRTNIKSLSYGTDVSCISFSCLMTTALNAQYSNYSTHKPILVADLMSYSNYLTGTAGTSNVVFQGVSVTTIGTASTNTFQDYGVTNPDLPACFTVTTPPTSPLVCDTTIANAAIGVNSGTNGWNNMAWDYKTSVFADNFYFAPYANRLYADYIYDVTMLRAKWR